MLVSKLRILITGSRNWKDESAIHNAIVSTIGDTPLESVILTHGNATGADTLAAKCALKIGIPSENIVAFKPDWERYGKNAGPIRNNAMINMGQDICLAFPMGESKGTHGCIKKAQAKGIPVIIY